MTPAKKDDPDFSRRPGRGGRPDIDYAILAREYVEIAGRSRSPLVDLAAIRGESRSTLANGLEEARNRELLTRPGQGKQGGNLTDKARKILADHENGDDR